MGAQDVPNHKLKLTELLDMLVTDGMVDKAEADTLVAERRSQRHDHHPLAVIAEKSWKSLLPPNRILTLESLTEWLAGVYVANDLGGLAEHAMAKHGPAEG